ncbi:glycosyltransferase, partial [Escherichia coli]|nr:glycosyltransferase [Escherichia coli]
PHAQLVMHLHNAFEPGELDKNAKIIVPSQFLFDFYSEKMPDANIAIVPNGFCSESYEQNNTEDLRQKLNIDANDTVLLFAGRISPDKGCLMLMEAFNQLNKIQDNLKLVIV